MYEARPKQILGALLRDTEASHHPPCVSRIASCMQGGQAEKEDLGFLSYCTAAVHHQQLGAWIGGHNGGGGR